MMLSCAFFLNPLDHRYVPSAAINCASSSRFPARLLEGLSTAATSSASPPLLSSGALCHLSPHCLCSVRTAIVKVLSRARFHDHSSVLVVINLFTAWTQLSLPSSWKSLFPGCPPLTFLAFLLPHRLPSWSPSLASLGSHVGGCTSEWWRGPTHTLLHLHVLPK